MLHTAHACCSPTRVPCPQLLEIAISLRSPAADGKYYRIDRFGHKLPENVVPLSVAEPDSRAADGGTAPEHQAGPGAGEMDFMMNRVSVFESLLHCC